MRQPLLNLTVAYTVRYQYRDTGVETKGLNVAITSEYEDSHNDIQKEKLRGQIPITPELLSDLPEIISGYDKVENATKSYDRKPALKFEKDINGKRVAIEYVRSKKGLLELQTMYAWEKKKSKGVSPTLTMPVKQTDPYRTSETYSGMAPANFSITDSKEQNNSKEGKTRFPKSKDSLWIFLYIERGSAQSS